MASRTTVEAYAGCKGEETPAASMLNGVRITGVGNFDHWYTETHSFASEPATTGAMPPVCGNACFIDGMELVASDVGKEPLVQLRPIIH